MATMNIFLLCRGLGCYKTTLSRYRIALTRCAMLPSDGEAGLVVQVRQQEKHGLGSGWSLPPPGSGIRSCLIISFVIIKGMEEMNSKLLSNSGSL